MLQVQEQLVLVVWLFVLRGTGRRCSVLSGFVLMVVILRCLREGIQDAHWSWLRASVPQIVEEIVEMIQLLSWVATDCR